MKFQKGNKAARGGRREPAGGRPTKAALDAKEEKLSLWQKEIEKHELTLARRYIRRALQSDRVLIDARKAVVPDARMTVNIEGGTGLLEQAVRLAREWRENKKR